MWGFTVSRKPVDISGPCDLKLSNLERATWGPKSYTSQLAEASHDRRKNERNERDLCRPSMLSFMFRPELWSKMFCF